MDNQDENDLAAAAAAALDAPQFHHPLQQPDFSHHHLDHDHGHDKIEEVHIDHQHHHDQDQHHDLDVQLDIPDDVNHDDLNLDLGMGTPTHDVDLDMGNDFRRPPTIRKACDLCHAAKQKCSGDRPTCTRCAAGGWHCVYAPRQRRRTVPKEQRGSSVTHDQPRSQVMSALNSQPQMSIQQQQMAKKRKLSQRDSAFGDGIDMQRAMGMAVDMGLAAEEEGEELMSMSDDQMLEAIAIDGYLADLPLSTFVHNLPYIPQQQQPDNHMTFNPEDFPAGDMDQHTTSALREAIFSLHESSGGGAAHGDGTGENQDNDGSGGQDETDPHLALLDLSIPGEDGNDGENQLSGLGNFTSSTSCNHSSVIPHVLSLLASQPLETKSGANTPLTLSVFSPLARSLRLFNSVTSCPNCSANPHQTLPQLALLSRTTTILTFPFPPVEPASGQTAQIQIHGARLAGTGVSQAIEQHIVGVIWDSWRASVREIFAAFERKAQEVITQTAMANAAAENGGQNASSSETQRAGLMFQAMSRLVTAMDEVEG